MREEQNPKAALRRIRMKVLIGYLVLLTLADESDNRDLKTLERGIYWWGLVDPI